MTEIDFKHLEKTLAKPPPHIEVVDEYEVYLLDDNDHRVKRICGMRDSNLPTFVPSNVHNPFNVENPYEAYRCTRVSATVNGVRIGYCTRHANDKSGAEEDKRDPEEILNEYKHTNNAVGGTKSLNEWINNVQSSLTVEELLDGTRLLFEIEAIRAMARAKAESLEDYDIDLMEHISKLMLAQTDMRLKMAKTDNELLKNQALSSIVMVILNGVVDIVEAKVGPEKAAAVLKEFKENLVIPISEQGFTEVLRRQKAAGIGEPIEIEANQFTVQKSNG